jgi:hypothetical protein
MSAPRRPACAAEPRREIKLLLVKWLGHSALRFIDVSPGHSVRRNGRDPARTHRRRRKLRRMTAVHKYAPLRIR